MNNLLQEAVYFGVFLTLFSYQIGLAVKKKFKSGLFNPLLISIILVMGILSVLKIDYATYYEGARYISYLLTPATICLSQ